MSENGKVLFFKKLRVDLRQTVELWVNLILRNGRFVSNQALKFVDLVLILGLKVFNVLLRNLDIRFEFKDVNQKLTFVGQLLFIVLNQGFCTGFGQFSENIEEHCVSV